MRPDLGRLEPYPACDTHPIGYMRIEHTIKGTGLIGTRIVVWCFFNLVQKSTDPGLAFAVILRRIQLTDVAW